MLRISKLTDYAVVLTTQLADVDEARNVRDLSTEMGIPQPTVSKVLKQLAQAGVVVSQRGVRGGYRLARAPERIHVAEIITALEGPIGVTECSTDDTVGACDREGVCGVQANWQRISAAVRQALEGITLADMVQGKNASELVGLARSSEEAARMRVAHS